MNKFYTLAKKGAQRLFIGFTAAAVVVGAFTVTGNPVLAAACSSSTDYGKVESSVSLPAAGTYRVWTRMMVPDSTNNTYLLEVNNNCYTVGGGSSIQSNAWVWVAHQNGNTSSKLDLSLGTGSVGYKLVGNKPGVKVDRLVFTTDLNCTPSGDGANCNTPSDTTPPTIELTAPAEGAVVNGPVDVAANASDNVGIAKVEFYVNSALATSDTAAPYSFTWDTTLVANGSQLVGAKAFDAAGNVSSDSFLVTVQNGDQQAPSVPGNVTATAPEYNKVVVNWQASSDNTGIKGYVVLRNTVPLVTLGNVTTYTDSTVTANSEYSYQVQAVDTSGNKSASSPKVIVKTPTTPDSEAPSAPTEVTATVNSQSQISLRWQASSDNIGVVGYDVYRAEGNGSAQKVTSVANTGYGDTNLRPNTTYHYYVVAKDGAGNTSQNSSSVEATTQAAKKKKSVVKGTIFDQATREHVHYASVVVPKGNTKNKHTFQANGDGEYRVRRLEAGFYNFTYRAKGYNSSTSSMNIAEGAVITKDVRLQKR